jgi:hypothetical protein
VLTWLRTFSRSSELGPTGRALPVLYQGERIEGVGRCYDTNSKGVMWGHALVSSALVQNGEDPYLLRCDPFPDALMSTERYPRLTATEAMPL